MAAPARDRFLAQMRALLGTHEDRGPNKNKITAAFRMDGQPWCAMTVGYAAKQAGIPTSVIPWTAGVAAVFHFARDHHRLVPVAQIQPGDLLCLEFDGRDGTYDHIEVATEAPSGGHVRTIGGNTRPDDAGHQSDGDGVYAKRRHLSLVRLVMRPDWALADRRKVPTPVKVVVGVGAAVAVGTGVVASQPPPKPVTVPPAASQTVTVRPTPRPTATKPTAPRPPATAKPAAKPVAYRTLAYGSTGNDVQAIQRKLGVTPVSGFYGRRTQRAVEAWQRRHGLTPDGIRGPRTAAGGLH